MKKSESLRIKIYVSLLIIILPIYAISQDSVYKFSPHWYVNLNAGLSYSQGDIAKHIDFPKWPDFNHISPGADLVMGRQLSPSFGLSTGIYYGLLTGMSENGNHFESDLFDYRINATINFNKLFGFSKDGRLSVHGSGGVGQAQYKTKVYDERGTTLYGYNHSLGELRGTGIDGRRVVMIFPLSMGLDYKLSDKVQLYVDYTLKLASSDLIDGKIKGDNNDNYNFTSIGLRFNFLKRKKTKPENEIVAEIEDEIVEQQDSVLAENPAQILELSPMLVDSLSDLVVAKLKPIIESSLSSKPVVEEKHEADPIKEKVSETKRALVQAPNNSKTTLSMNSKKEYCVQIRASFKKPLEISDLSNQCNLEQSKISYKGIHNNWHLYTVGSFATFNEANQERIQLKENHGITDAFVVCFENGKRIIE